MRATRSAHSPEVKSMSEWSYIYGAYALTWVSLAAYALYVRARRVRAQQAPASSATDRSES